jgi:hypothetical protein
MATSLSLLARPLSALLDDDELGVEKDGCLVPQNIWRRWVDAQEAEVLLVEIQQGGTRFILCVEGPHQQSTMDIYIPGRYMRDLVFEERVRVQVLEEMPPNATEIVLQPLDGGFGGVDLASAASQFLSNWNVLTAGSILSIPCEELGGFEVDVLVKQVEPAATVLLRGEVPLVLEDPTEHEFLPQPVVQQPVVAEEDEDFNSMVPVSLPQATSAFSGNGRRLGGK